MARLAINDLTLNVEQAGSGPPLVLLHGFTGCAASWRDTMAALAPRARVIAVDLIGHGASDAPGDPARYAVEHAVRDLLALFDHLALDDIILLGYSMGGRVALQLALTAPRRLRGLLLESASPGIADGAERGARRRADEDLAAAIERDGIERFVANWERLPLFESQRHLSPDRRHQLCLQRLQNSESGLANSLRGMGAGVQAPLWDRLGTLEVPTAVIVGALDTKYVAIGRQMVAALPRAALHIVPGAGHAVHLEQPEHFNSLVQRQLTASGPAVKTAG